MWPAIALDDSDWNGHQARGWSVVTTLRTKQRRLQQARRDAARRVEADANLMHMMTPGVIARQMADVEQSEWAGEFTVMVFVFAPPGSRTMELLDRRLDVLDARSAEKWDAFFAGYYTSDADNLERQVGSQLVGERQVSHWYFNASYFNSFRNEIETATGGNWKYSGGSDILAVSAWIRPHGDPIIDWASLVSGSLTEPLDGVATITLAQAVELISRDLEQQVEDARFGLKNLVGPATAVNSDSTAKKVMVGALGGFLAGLGKSVAGF